MTTRIRSKPKRRFLRFTLSSLLLAILVLCVVLGWKVERVRKQRDAVSWVQQFRGRGVSYDYQIDDSGRPIPDAEPTRPKWLMEQLGIDFFHDVVRVNLTSKEQVSDISPLASLTSLEVLQLDGTQVSDVTPLAGLTNLKKLYLDDIQVLDWWTGPDVLRLDGTQVSDVTALSGLTSLQALHIDGTQVSDLTPLHGLRSLKRLSIWNAAVSQKAFEQLQRALPQCEISGEPTTHWETTLEPARENDRPMSMDEWHQHEMPWRPRVPKIDKGLFYPY